MRRNLPLHVRCKHSGGLPQMPLRVTLISLLFYKKLWVICSMFCCFPVNWSPHDTPMLTLKHLTSIFTFKISCKNIFRHHMTAAQFIKWRFASVRLRSAARRFLTLAHHLGGIWLIPALFCSIYGALPFCTALNRNSTRVANLCHAAALSFMISDTAVPSFHVRRYISNSAHTLSVPFWINRKAVHGCTQDFHE